MHTGLRAARPVPRRTRGTAVKKGARPLAHRASSPSATHPHRVTRALLRTRIRHRLLGAGQLKRPKKSQTGRTTWFGKAASSALFCRVVGISRQARYAFVLRRAHPLRAYELTKKRPKRARNGCVAALAAAFPKHAKASSCLCCDVVRCNTLILCVRWSASWASTASLRWAFEFDFQVTFRLM